MTGRSSGRLWCWLIERLVSTPHRDAMIGDLIEQSRRGRSEMWWARQACAIIVGSLAREIAHHRGLAASALLVGCATAALAGNVTRFSPDVATVVAVWVVFRVYRPIRFSALFVLIAFISAMRLTVVSFVVMSVLGHFGGLEFLIREGLRQFSMPALLGAALLGFTTRQQPIDRFASRIAG
jgi:hypothetical protein